MRVAVNTIKNRVLFSLSSKFALVLGGQILLSTLLSIVSLLLFLKLSEDVFSKETIYYDGIIMNFIYGLRTPTLDHFMLIITTLGDPIVLFPLSIFFSYFLYTKRRKDALIFSAIIYTGVLTNGLLKFVFQRDRPDMLPLILEHSYSFPSAHAMNSFVFYITIAYFLLRHTKNLKLFIVVTLLALLLILIVGFSRVYLGVHYPSDVFAGFAGGFCWFVSAIAFEKTVIFERLYKAINKTNAKE